MGALCLKNQGFATVRWLFGNMREVGDNVLELGVGS